MADDLHEAARTTDPNGNRLAFWLDDLRARLQYAADQQAEADEGPEFVNARLDWHQQAGAIMDLCDVARLYVQDYPALQARLYMILAPIRDKVERIDRGDFDRMLAALSVTPSESARHTLAELARLYVTPLQQAADEARGHDLQNGTPWPPIDQRGDYSLQQLGDIARTKLQKPEQREAGPTTEDLVAGVLDAATGRMTARAIADALQAEKITAGAVRAALTRLREKGIQIDSGTGGYALARKL